MGDSDAFPTVKTGDLVANGDDDSDDYMEGIVLGPSYPDKYPLGEDGWFKVRWQNNETWDEWYGDLTVIHPAEQVTIFF